MSLLPAPQSVTLDQGRALLRRAIDKAEALHQAGAFVVVDAGGAPVTGSRMDGAGGSGFGISRAKAYVSAVNREPSEVFGQRMTAFFPGVFAAYQRILRDHAFPAGGGVPIRQDGKIVGALSTGGSIGPRVKIPGIDPQELLVDGKPCNAEDLIISYALDQAYSPQHGDDLKRWIEAYGGPPDGRDQGRGLASPPAAVRQPGLAQARRISQAVVAEAGRHGIAVSVVVSDRLGDVVQLDRMDGAPPMGPDLAEALAVTAVNFVKPTAALAGDFGQSALDQIARIAPYRLLFAPGGLPIMRHGQLQGALGISGPPAACHEIGLAVLQTTTIEGDNT